MDNVCGKPIKLKKEFKNTGDDFSGVNAARKFLEEKGFSIGSMQRNSPMGVKKGDFCISKWRNLSSEDILQLDGCLFFHDSGPRNGTCTVYLNIEIEG